MPDLVRVTSPETEAELAAIVEMLEAHGIPCFVCDARLGWVSSGVRGCVRKPRAVMVPGTRVTEATDLIQVFQSSPAAHDDVACNHLWSQLRALVRLISFGWYQPAARNFK
jgi:hypothetical protein